MMMKKATTIFLPDDFLPATLLLFEMNGFLDLLMTDKRCLDCLLFLPICQMCSIIISE